jgi:hypothetical protein
MTTLTMTPAQFSNQKIRNLARTALDNIEINNNIKHNSNSIFKPKNQKLRANHCTTKLKMNNNIKPNSNSIFKPKNQKFRANRCSTKLKSTTTLSINNTSSIFKPKASILPNKSLTRDPIVA